MSYGAVRNTKYARSQERIKPHDEDAFFAWWEDIYWHDDPYDMSAWAEDDRSWGRICNMGEYHQFKLLNFLVKLLIKSADEEIEGRYW